MIALGGPKLKLSVCSCQFAVNISFNDSTGWA